MSREHIRQDEIVEGERRASGGKPPRRKPHLLGTFREQSLWLNLSEKQYVVLQLFSKDILTQIHTCSSLKFKCRGGKGWPYMRDHICPCYPFHILISLTSYRWCNRTIFYLQPHQNVLVFSFQIPNYSKSNLAGNWWKSRKNMKTYQESLLIAQRAEAYSSTSIVETYWSPTHTVPNEPSLPHFHFSLTSSRANAGFVRSACCHKVKCIIDCIQLPPKLYCQLGDVP